MADVTIRTNNRPRDLLYWWDLTAKEQKEFDYLDTEDRQQEASFIRYKGWVYDLGDFMSTRGMPEFSPIAGWDGYQGDSYFSGTVVRWVKPHCEQVIIGTYMS